MRHKKLTETSREGTLAAAAAPEGDLKKAAEKWSKVCLWGRSWLQTTIRTLQNC